MLRDKVLKLTTSLAMQMLSEGELSYGQAIKQAIDEVCVRLDKTRKELMKEVGGIDGVERVL